MEIKCSLHILGYLFVCLSVIVKSEIIALPSFSELKKYYPGFYHFRGTYRNHNIATLLGVQNSANFLLHDTTALRLSYTLNTIGGKHSIGSNAISLSKYGMDSVPGNNGLQFIFHPLAFGPYLADKYGYPTVSKMHLFDPVKTRESFLNKQGIMRVITYTQKDNEPKGHIALWNCNGFHQSRDFFKGHTLLSVEFWESPDTSCSSDEQRSESIDIIDTDVKSEYSDTQLLSLLKSTSRDRFNHRKRHSRH